MWWCLLALILSISTVVVIFRGPVAGLGCGILISLLFPCWITETFAGAPIDLRIATSLLLLLVNLVDRRRRISWKFSAGDWSVLVLYVVHVASDSWHDGWTFAHLVRAFGEWSIPYIGGRLSVQNVQDWRWLTGIAVTVTTVFALWSTAEAISRVNPANPMFGTRELDRTPLTQIRLGLKRAEGPTRHSIWFGMVQTLLLPWTIVAAYRGLRGDGPTWWMVTPLLSSCGILATVARGPAIAGLVIFYLTAIFCFSKLRMPLILIGIVLFGMGIVGQRFVFESLERWSSKQWGRTQQHAKVVIDGEKHQLTAVSYRWLMLSAYGPAVSHTGLLGYGTARTATFPPNIPLGPDAKQAVSQMWSIDSEYLLLLLRFGWLGLGAFLAVCLTSILHVNNQSKFVSAQEQILPLAVAATLVATSLTLFVEWMPHDYGFLFLWTCGVANGIRITPGTESSRKSKAVQHAKSL